MTSIPATTPPLYLAEVTIWDPAKAATRVLYFSTKPFTTKASETPASTWYNPVIKQPLDVTRNLFTGGNTSGASIVGLGDLVLSNPDGALDDLLDYGFDGQALTVRVTTTLNPSYPADFTTIFSGTMAAAEFDDQTVTIKARDLLASLQLPFQTSKYGGTNVLPNGLDGVATDLAGKVKPVLLGGSVTNIAPPCVNTDKLIYQISDGAIASVDAVYDRGIPLTNGVLSWTQLSAAFSGGYALAAVSANGVFMIAGSSGQLFTSSDLGATWTSRTSGFGTNDIRGLCYGNGLFVAVGVGGMIATSADNGVTWTSRTSGFGTSTINCVAFANGVFVAGGASGLLETSPDAVTWTARTTHSFSAQGIFGLAYGGGVWVAVGAPSNANSSVDNGVTWVEQSTAATTAGQPYNAVAFGSVGFVAVGAGGLISTSADGKTWTVRYVGTSVFGSNSIATASYGNGLYVAATSSGSGDSGAVSLDGVVWTTGITVGSIAMFSSAYDGKRFLFAGKAGFAYISSSGLLYSTLADLQDDTQRPAPGTYGTYLGSSSDGSYIRLGSPAIGTITCDATQGSTSADRTAAQLYNTVQLRANPSASVNATDLTTLDGQNSAPLGIWINDDTTFAAVIDQIAGSVGAGWWPSASGEWRIKRIAAATGNPLLSLGPNDLTQPLKIVTTTDDGDGVPAYRCTVNWGQNYTVQTTDLATGVTDDRRAVLAQEWRAAVSTDLSVQAAHPLSPALSKDSLFTNAADAQAEADRWQALMGTQRYRFLAVAPMTSETLPLDLGDEMELVNPRFALQAAGGDTGAQFIVLDIEPSAQDETITFTAWGAGKASRNIVTDDGFEWATDDGVLVVTATDN